MKSFTEFHESRIQKIEQAKKSLYCIFDRFSPPTRHDSNYLESLANLADNSPFRIYVAPTSQSEKNPLTYSERVHFIRKLYPKYARQTVKEESITSIKDVITSAINEGFENITFLTAKDKIESYQRVCESTDINVYFESFTEYTSVNDSAKCRKAAIENDFDAFSLNFTSVTESDLKREMFEKIHSRYGDKDDVETITEENIRDLYTERKIFQQGSYCEDQDGNQLKILKNGPNFVSALNEETGETKKYWLTDLQPIR